MSLTDNNKIRRFSTYRTDRLSSIPSMASAISKKISEFQQQYRKLVDDAVDFFAEYQAQQQELKRLKERIAAYQEQIQIIMDYKQEKGKLPIIRGQKSTARYLERLYSQRDKFKNEHASLFRSVTKQRIDRFNALDNLTDHILDLLSGPKILSQFLGTISLSTPLPEESVRCVRNEKYKPIYITALTVALFEEVRQRHVFANPYLKENLDDIFGEETLAYMTGEQSEIKPVDKMKYREEVLKPLAKAALVHSIGSYSPEVEAIFDGNRYRQLLPDERERLVELTRVKSSDYLKLGIGLPPRRFDTRDEKTAFTRYESRKLRFMLGFIDADRDPSNELCELLRLPMVYSSFMISTKAEHDYPKIYAAYDVIEQGMKTGTYQKKFARLFLNMVGRFPLGSGIYFVDKVSKVVEKAIVSSLYPKHVDEPICKRITRQQVQSLSQAELIISRDYNLYFEPARQLTEIEPEMLSARYGGEFSWNANEIWEVQLPALTFWKKDGNLLEN